MVGLGLQAGILVYLEALLLDNREHVAGIWDLKQLELLVVQCLNQLHSIKVLFYLLGSCSKLI